ncbi:response regulator transcription factor [Devosia sp. YIM 151766]|uniref:response regulator transcription factor n=1 Tax=Devosia sp. YIM 151766 TaxID=3017325 RepID=UPI00255CADE5|nr:response regulator transcription factor [Devosia sp. YIM 151766]WIY54195.1 response regulator transcription factor [Devosia sp. YIM 151766]
MLIDAFEMRRAGIAALLKPWAIALNALVVSRGPDELESGLPEGVRSIFVLFSIGGMSLKSKQVHDWVGAICTELPDVPCIVLSDRTEPEEAVAAARMGLSAFIATSIDPQVALQAFALVINGGTYFPRNALLQAWEPQQEAYPDCAESSALTPRQSQVLQRLRVGCSNKLIARDLSLQESTVKVHVREILRKLGARNRTEAALLAARKGIHRTAIASPSDEWPSPPTVQASAH